MFGLFLLALGFSILELLTGFFSVFASLLFFFSGIYLIIEFLLREGEVDSFKEYIENG